jgi:hypothetical protein
MIDQLRHYEPLNRGLGPKFETFFAFWTVIGLDHRYMGTCGSRLALGNRILVGLDHLLNRRSYRQFPRIQVVPSPLMGKEKGVSDGQSVNLERIKGQNAARTNEGFPYNSFSLKIMTKTMRKTNERNGVC